MRPSTTHAGPVLFVLATLRDVLAASTVRAVAPALLVALALGSPALVADGNPDIPRGTGPVPAEAMKDVSFEGLDEAGKKRAVELLNQGACDCGCGMKVAVCRRDDSTCGRSKAVAAQVVAMVREGKTSEEIVKAAFEPPSKFVQFALLPGDAPAVGPPTAKVTILQYVDYQCPFCRRVAATMDQLHAAYPDDLRIVYKMHPLGMHPQAPLAAEAALAAHAQGKFAAMHAKLYESSQTDLSRERILALAREVGCDMERFTRELDQHVHAAMVAREAGEAMGVGATGTPASFVNGRYLPGAKSFAVFKAMIDEELAWAKAGNRPAFRTAQHVSEAAPPRAAPSGPDPGRKAPAAGTR